MRTILRYWLSGIPGSVWAGVSFVVCSTYSRDLLSCFISVVTCWAGGWYMGLLTAMIWHAMGEKK